MGVSWRGERMIGNMAFSLFNGEKGKQNFGSEEKRKKED